MALNQTQYGFGIKKTLVYSLIPLLVLMLFLEVTARVAEIWWPPIPVDIGLGFTEESRLFVPCPSRPEYVMTNPQKAIVKGWHKVAKFFLDDIGSMPFRWQQFSRVKPQDTYRIFCIGESSVNYANEDLLRMTQRLEKRFPEYKTFELINCGGCGYGSHRLVLVFGEILQYQPDAILLYLGHNEFEEQEQLHYAQLKWVPLQKLLWKSAFVRFCRDRVATLQIERMTDNRSKDILNKDVHARDLSERHFSKEQISERMDAFQNNIELMVQLARKQDVPVILGTIPSNLMQPDLISPDKERYASEVLSKFASGDYEEGKKLAQEILAWTCRRQASDLENQRLRHVAEEWHVPIADVEKAITEAEPHRVPGETLFKDHCHLNDEGRRIMVAEYEKELTRVIDNRRSDGRLEPAHGAAAPDDGVRKVVEPRGSIIQAAACRRNRPSTEESMGKIWHEQTPQVPALSAPWVVSHCHDRGIMYVRLSCSHLDVTRFGFFLSRACGQSNFIWNRGRDHMGAVGIMACPESYVGG